MASNTNYENYDPLFPDQPVVDLYLPVWAKLPAFASKPAFIWVEDAPDGKSLGAGRAITYAELNESVGCISSQLLVPLQRGDRVVVLSPPGLELIEIIFGCQRAGLLAVPMLPPDPCSVGEDFHHLVRVLSQTEPKSAIAPSRYITSFKASISDKSNTKLANLMQKLRWIATEDLKTANGHRTPYSPSPSPDLAHYYGCNTDDVYLIQYTSGATGIPKPVLITAGAAAHNVREARRSYDLQPSSMIVSWLPQYHDCGLMFLLLTIVSGATSVLASPAAFLRRPRIWLEMISEFQATCTPVPSFTLPLVVKRGGVNKGQLPIKLWSMRNLIIINEPIYRDTVEEFVKAFGHHGLDPAAIAPSYGLAENCTFVSTAWRPSSVTNGTSVSFPNIPTYNRLLPSMRFGLGHQQEDNDVDVHILVVDEETSSPLDDGVEGEIWISSPSNASGYLGHPSLTREVFQNRLKARISRCFIRTGDRGVIIPHDRSRYLFVTGRCSDTIRLVSGKNDEEIVMIHPHYIETAVYKSLHRFLRGGCIVAFKNSSNTVAVVAELQQRSGDRETLKRLCDGVRKAVLEAEGVEVGLVALVENGSVAKTTSGKVRRWATRDQLNRGTMKVAALVEFDGSLDAPRIEGDGRSVVRSAERGGGSWKSEGITSQESGEVEYSLSSINQPHRRIISFL